MTQKPYTKDEAFGWVTMGLERVRIVLVEPAGPLNVGAIARVMKNQGLTQLVLVNPQCDHLGSEAMQMAVHAANILSAAAIVPSLPDALAGCTCAIATTGRDSYWEKSLEHPRTALPWLLEPTEPATALIFGAEYRGLSNEELNYAQRFIRIPSNPEYPSLNLATAVAICCYELAQIMELGTASPVSYNSLPQPQLDLAPLDAVEGYYQHLESLLLKIGYLYPHTASSRMAKFRQLFNRTQLQTTEVAMLRGILSQVEWAIEKDVEG